jgi:hypothetical protein
MKAESNENRVGA